MIWMRHSLQQSVWEVMTDPSTVARRPTPMTVQLSSFAVGLSAESEGAPESRIAPAATNVMSRRFRIFYSPIRGRTSAFILILTI
jgi:hypothetical protein